MDTSLPPTHKKTIDGLEYDPLTGFFTWVAPKARRVKAGDRAGNINSNGYERIMWNGKRHYSAHLAWYFMYGKWPDEFIDHINMIPLDNRIVNLRECTIKQNSCNRKGRRAGLKGVRKSGKKWAAQIKHNQEVFHIGIFDTEQMAHEAYVKVAKEMHGEFFRAD